MGHQRPNKTRAYRVAPLVKNQRAKVIFSIPHQNGCIQTLEPKTSIINSQHQPFEVRRTKLIMSVLSSYEVLINSKLHTTLRSSYSSKKTPRYGILCDPGPFSLLLFTVHSSNANRLCVLGGWRVFSPGIGHLRGAKLVPFFPSYFKYRVACCFRGATHPLTWVVIQLIS